MRRLPGSETRTGAAFATLAVVSLVMLLPIYFMVITSLKRMEEIFLFPPTPIPAAPTLASFVDLFTSLRMGLYYRNSVVVAGLCVLGTTFSSSFAAFGFSRYAAPGKKLLFTVLLATMMLPYPVTMIPQFLLFKRLGWIDTFLPLVVPAFFGSAYMIFLMRQFYGSLSEELFDAARIDGCGEVRIYWNVALPLCGPALATVAIFTFLWTWDDLLGPIIYLNSADKQTIPVVLSSMRSKYRVTPWNTLMAGAICAVLPSVALFAFLQRYFVEGIATTGLRS